MEAKQLNRLLVDLTGLPKHMCKGELLRLHDRYGDDLLDKVQIKFWRLVPYQPYELI